MAEKRLFAEKNRDAKIKLLSLVVPAVGIMALYNYLPHYVRGGLNLNSVHNYQAIMPLAIVGSGPAGLTAALYGARGGLRTYILEGNKPGGLLTETTEVENWPGEKLILGPDLIEQMKNQVQRLGAIFISDSVESIDLDQWPYKITFESGRSAYALSVIIATGATPRRLGIKGEQEYWGYGVTTCAVCDAPFRKGQDVLVVGGGDSAVEEAIQLAPHAKNVTIMVRKDHMRAAARMQDRLKGYPNIKIRYNVELKKIMGETKKGPFGDDKVLNEVEVYNNKTKESEQISNIKGVFLAIGHDPNSQLVCSRVKCDKSGYIIPQGRSQKTSIKGVFVAGDVADPVYRQAITSSASGCMAALDAAAFFGEIGANESFFDSIEHQYYYEESDDTQAVQYVESVQELNEVLEQSPGVVMVDFYGQACPSCLQMLPVYEQVAREKSDAATFVKVDVDEATDIVNAYNIVKVPCVMVFKSGKPVKTIYSTLRRKEIIAEIEGDISAS